MFCAAIGFTEAAQLGLAAALLVAAAFYAWYTRSMVGEMRATRQLSIAPRLGLTIRPLSGNQGWLLLRSLGPGTACDVRVEMRFSPYGGTRTWTTPFLAPGEHVEFRLPGEALEEQFDLPRHSEGKLVVRVVGVMRDVRGGEHVVSEELEVADWWTVSVESERSLGEEVGEKIVRVLARIAKAVSQT